MGKLNLLNRVTRPIPVQEQLAQVHQGRWTHVKSGHLPEPVPAPTNNTNAGSAPFAIPEATLVRIIAETTQAVMANLQPHTTTQPPPESSMENWELPVVVTLGVLGIADVTMQGPVVSSLLNISGEPNLVAVSLPSTPGSRLTLSVCLLMPT